MAFSLDELQAQRDSIRRAIRSGALMVQHGDKIVRYRSIGELQGALMDVQNEIAELSGNKPNRIRYSTFTKALG